MPNNKERFAATRDYVVLPKGFRGFIPSWQLRLHLQDSENGVYRQKNGNETFTANELDTAVKEGALEDISIAKRPI